MKTVSIISFYFAFMSIAQAGLEGDYQLISGSSTCPIGNVSLKTNPKEKERVFLFGSSIAWNLNEQDKGETKEAAEGGCAYTMTYEKSAERFTAKTQRASCPNAAENGVITETMTLKNTQMNYQYEFVSASNKKTEYKCSYNRK